MNNSSIKNQLSETRLAEARSGLEALGCRLRQLIASQPPKDLLGYIYSAFLLGEREERAAAAINATNFTCVELDQAQFLLEFVHAVLATSSILAEARLDESVCAEITHIAERLRNDSFSVAMMIAATSSETQFGPYTKDLLFRALSNWVLMRGTRYQVLEEEFFNFALEPHSDALRRAYDVGACEIASGIQALSDSVRTGHEHAIRAIEQSMKDAEQFSSARGLSPEEGIPQWTVERSESANAASVAMTDLLQGGICNVRRHTDLPASLLDDLSYRVAEETEFFAPGPYSGTPFRTLPARKKPLIKLDGDHYLTDPSFARDASYRAILHNLLIRNPEYTAEFKRRQKEWSESAFANVFKDQFLGAKILHEVYYRLDGHWFENDTLILIDGVLMLVEAKSGAAATIASPAASFERHARAVHDLIFKAYGQCRRFLDYLASADEVPLFAFEDGRYKEVTRIRLSDYWLVLPIGLTVESYSPFSTSSKQLPGIAPILGKYPFISVAIDEILVVARFLPSTGALMHYLRIRQEAAGIKELFLFDELDHLGAYITKNRFCDDLRPQLAEGANLIVMDGMSSVIDDYFSMDDWEQQAAPAQEVPEELRRLLAILEQTCAPGWIEADSCLRDFGLEGRHDLARQLEPLRKSLEKYPHRYFAVRVEFGLLFWLYRSKEIPDMAAAQFKAQAVAESFGVERVLLVVTGVDDEGGYASVRLHTGADACRRRLKPLERTQQH